MCVCVSVDFTDGVSGCREVSRVELKRTGDLS